MTEKEVRIAPVLVAPLGVMEYHERRRPLKRILAAITVAITLGALIVSLLLVPARARTLRATSASGKPGPLHIPGQTGEAARVDPRDVGSSKTKEYRQVRQTEVCFTVHVIGDPAAYQVSGTLFHNRKHYTGGRTALFLQHGSVATRSAWDGERPQVTGVPSMARSLAAAGYDVFAIDRLGYGRSPYRGSGWALTMDAYVEMTHEMVGQIREGRFRVSSTGSCDGAVEAGRGASKVVLMGFSGGAGLTEYYATRYHDIDGIVPLTWSSQGSSNRFGDYFVTEVGPQLAQGKDYVYLFDIGADGYSQSCEDFLFYTDGVRKDALEQLCGPEGFGGDEPELMPSGDISTQPLMMQEIKLTIGNVGPTPALLVFADKDAIFTSAEFGDGEPDTITPEMEMWTNRCNCEVEFLWQENAGHAAWFHESATETSDGILDWLRSRGL